MLKKKSIFTLAIGMWLTLMFGFLYLPLVPWFTNDRSINIFVWYELITEDTIVAFEKETGIKVNVSYFDLNEEVFAKLKATGGAGYDLVTPSHFFVELLVNEKLVKPLDKTKLNFMDRLDPVFLNLPFDPGNKYSVPFYWGTFGIAVNTKFFGGKVPEASWDLVFKEGAAPGGITMSDGMREITFVAARYLFPEHEGMLTDAQIKELKQLLIKQKQWVEAYAEARASYLVYAGNCAASMMTGSELWRFMLKNPDLVFLSPKEGGFLHIDSLLIPTASTKNDLVYQFINYLYRKEALERRFDEYGFLPPTTTEMRSLVAQEGIKGKLPVPGTPGFSSLRLMGSILTNEQLNDVWLALKG